VLETIYQIEGVLIAAAIIYAARELRRVSNSIIRLDYRVGDLERMFQSARLREPQRWNSDNDGNEEGGGPGESGG
jgi:hypothetical protein